MGMMGRTRKRLVQMLSYLRRSPVCRRVSTTWSNSTQSISLPHQNEYNSRIVVGPLRVRSVSASKLSFMETGYSSLIGGL